MLVKTINCKDIKEGEIKKFEDNNFKLAIYFVKNKYYATSLICAHEHAHLDEGYLEDDFTIVCPLHGAKYDIRTGDVLALPATEGIKSYPVFIKDDVLYVEVSDDDCKECKNCNCKHNENEKN